MQKCFVQKPANVKAEWLLVDAENQVLGRLASQIAKVIRGKHKPTFTPHANDGDRVIVINADSILVYHGAIDDKKSADPGDIATAKNLVAAAIDETLAGKPVSTPETEAYGCSIKYGN